MGALARVLEGLRGGVLSTCAAAYDTRSRFGGWIYLADEAGPFVGDGTVSRRVWLRIFRSSRKAFGVSNCCYLRCHPAVQRNLDREICFAICPFSGQSFYLERGSTAVGNLSGRPPPV